MTFFLSCPFPPLTSRGEGIRVEYVHSVYWSRGKHCSSELALLKMLCMEKEMQNHIQPHVPCLFEIINWFSKYCLQCFLWVLHGAITQKLELQSQTRTLALCVGREQSVTLIMLSALLSKHCCLLWVLLAGLKRKLILVLAYFRAI